MPEVSTKPRTTDSDLSGPREEQRIALDASRQASEPCALVRRPRRAEEVSAEELLVVAGAKSHRLSVALATIVFFNLAIVSGVVTFWALAVRS